MWEAEGVEFGGYRRVAMVMADMREEGAARGEVGDDGQALLDRQVGRMRSVAQSVENENVESM